MEQQPTTSHASHPPPPKKPHLCHRCEHCGKCFARADNLLQHIRNRHGDPTSSQLPGQHGEGTVDLLPPYVQDAAVEQEEEEHRFFRLYKTQPRQRPRFGLEESAYRAELTEAAQDEAALWVEGMGSLADVVLRIVEALIDRVGGGLNDRDLIQLSIFATGPHGLDYPLYIPPTRKKDLTAELILNHLERILQSNEQFRLDGNLVFEIVTARLPFGGKRNKSQPIAEEKWLKQSSSILVVKNRDENCFSRALVIGLAHLLQGLVTSMAPRGRPLPPQWVADDTVCHKLWGRNTCHNVVRREQRQARLAADLRHKAGLADGRAGVAEMKTVQTNYLTRLGIRLVVFAKRYHGMVIFRGPSDLPRHLYLYYYSEHFAVLTSPQAFLNRSYFCEFCVKGFDVRNHHRCERTCHRCQKINGMPCQGDLTRCDHCLMWFAGEDCYDHHIDLGTCQRTRYCAECGAFLRDATEQKNHECGTVKCYKCSVRYRKLTATGEKVQHRCYIQPLVDEFKKKKKENDDDDDGTTDNLLLGLPPADDVDDDEEEDRAQWRIVCYDVETATDFEPDSTTMGMVVNCVAAMIVCSLCHDHSSVVVECPGCGPRPRSVCFLGTDSMDRFCRWLLDVPNGDEKQPWTMCFAHNFR